MGEARASQKSFSRRSFLKTAGAAGALAAAGAMTGCGDWLSAATDTAKDETKSGDTWLYVGVGAVALVVLALVVFLIAKKKKTPAGGNKE